MNQYEFFDNKIFDITKIQIGFSLSDGQKKELLEVAGEIEAAYLAGSLSGTDRNKLLSTMADCGLEFPAVPPEQTIRQRKGKRGAKGQER